MDRDALKKRRLDYAHFSPDCSSFSKLARHCHGRKVTNAYMGTSAACQEGNKMLKKVCYTIEDQLDQNPNFIFTVENPDGNMQNQPLVKALLEESTAGGGVGATKCIIDYCWFTEGETRFRKRTHFWTNSKELIREFGPENAPRFMCTRQSPCPCFGPGGHKPVQGNSPEATPFPPHLCEVIARLLSRELAAQRFRPL